MSKTKKAAKTTVDSAETTQTDVASIAATNNELANTADGLTCGLNKLALDELFAIDTSLLNTLDMQQLRQIAESAALHADDIEADYATGASELEINVNSKQVARDVMMLLNSNKYKIHAKNATAIVRTNAIFDSIAKATTKTVAITNSDYQNILVAFGTEFEGNLHTAKTLTNVFIVLSEMSMSLQAAQKTVQDLSVLYNAAVDVIDAKTAAASAQDTTK